jgi:hypothetical protein
MRHRHASPGLVVAIVALTACSAESEPAEDGPPCPAFSGMTREGNSWLYRASDAQAAQGYAARAEYRVTSMGANRKGTRRFVEVESFTTAQRSDSTYTNEALVQYFCDEQGLWIHARYEHTVSDPPPGSGSDFNSNDHGTDFETKYYPPVLLLPSDLHDGSTWATTTDEIVNLGSHTRTYELAAATSTTTPAGFFDAIDVTQTLDGYPSHFYYTASEGLVASPDYVLEQYTP